MKPCARPPTKDVLVAKLIEICDLESYNIAWIDKLLPNKKRLLDVLATLVPLCLEQESELNRMVFI